MDVIRAGCGNAVILSVLFFGLLWLLGPTLLRLLQVVLETLNNI